MEVFLAILMAYLIDGVIFGCIARHVAESRGYDDGFVWGFFLGLIGLLVVGFRPEQRSEAPVAHKPMYPNAQPKPREQWECTCGARNPVTMDYCLSCRRDRRSIVPVRRMPCPHCGAQNRETNATCFACGRPLREDAPVPEVPAPQAPAPAAPTTTDCTALLEKLAQLHEAGILTDDEFAAKKAELLSRI